MSLYNIADSLEWKKVTRKRHDAWLCNPLCIGAKMVAPVPNEYGSMEYIVTDEHKQCIVFEYGYYRTISKGEAYLRYFSPAKWNGTDADQKIDFSKRFGFTHVLSSDCEGMVEWAAHVPTSKATNLVIDCNVINDRKIVSVGMCGDFIVCSDYFGQPNLNDYRIVHSNEFARTYDLRTFAGVIPDRLLDDYFARKPDIKVAVKRSTETNRQLEGYEEPIVGIVRGVAQNEQEYIELSRKNGEKLFNALRDKIASDGSINVNEIDEKQLAGRQRYKYRKCMICTTSTGKEYLILVTDKFITLNIAVWNTEKERFSDGGKLCMEYAHKITNKWLDEMINMMI